MVVKSRIKNQESKIFGFTLIEVVTTVAIFTILAYGTLALISNLIGSSAGQSALLSGSDQARKAVFNLTNELRNASTSGTGGYPLAEASAQQLTFYSNVDGGSDIERLRYFVNAGALYRGVLKPGGSPLAYDPANEISNVAQSDLGNGGNPVFYYFDDTYDGTVDNYLLQPVNINNVKLVKIRLDIVNTGGTTDSNLYTVTGEATMRNLKTNLGS